MSFKPQRNFRAAVLTTRLGVAGLPWPSVQRLGPKSNHAQQSPAAGRSTKTASPGRVSTCKLSVIDSRAAADHDTIGFNFDPSQRQATRNLLAQALQSGRVQVAAEAIGEYVETGRARLT